MSSFPIKSYGIIVFTKDKNNNIKFLLYQRRDTFEYMDFMLGNWKNYSELKSIFSFMTLDEKYRLRNYIFDELWDDLWVIHDFELYREKYSKSKKKYESIKYNIPYLTELTKVSKSEPSWGFPKGKKLDDNETNKECSLREFQEETKINSNRLKFIKDKFFFENFIGTNGKHYSTNYMLAYMEDPQLPEYTPTPQCIRKYCISEEVSNLGWFNIEECKEKLTSFRYDMLLNIIEHLD